jgi:hypothetical protein
MKKSCSLLKPHELQRDQNNDDSTISTLIKKSCFKYFANDSTNFSTVLLNTQSLIDSNLSQPTTLQPTTVLVHQPQINYSFNQEQQQQQHQQNYKLKENYNHTTDELMQNNTYQNLNMFNNKILNERASPNHSNSDLNLIKQSENNLFINNNTHNEYQNTTVNFLNYKSSILNSSSDDLFGLHENNVVDLADDLSSCNQQNFIELITATKDSNLSFINHNQVSYYGNTCV